MNAFVSLIGLLLQILSMAIFIRAILSWFMQVGGDPITRLLVDITDPILEPIRNLLQRILPMPLDLSPIIAILLLNFLAGQVSAVARTL